MRSSTIFILAFAALSAPALAVPAHRGIYSGTKVGTPDWYRMRAVARAVSDIDESGAAGRNINWQQVASSVAGILPYVSQWLPTGEKSEDQQQQQPPPQRRDLDAVYDILARSVHENYRRENDVVYELLARAVDDIESGALNWQQVADTAAGILPHLIPFLPDGTPKAPKPPRSELHEFLARAMDELD